MKCLAAKTEKKGTVTITVKSGKNQSKSYKIISNDEKKPSTVNVGGFFVERKIRWKHFVVVLNPDPSHILCVREGEDDQGGTGKESFCRQYQEASSGSTAGL